MNRKLFFLALLFTAERKFFDLDFGSTMFYQSTIVNGEPVDYGNYSVEVFIESCYKYWRDSLVFKR